MPDVTMPDGSVVTGVPDTPEARQQLASAWQAKQAQSAAPADPTTARVAPEQLDDRPMWAQRLFPQSEQDTVKAIKSINVNRADEARIAAQAKLDATHNPAPPVPQPGASLADKAGYYGKLGGSAIMRGLLSVPTMAADAGLALDPRPGAIASPGDADRLVAALGQQPATQPQKYAADALQGATAAVTGTGGAGPVRAGVSGAGAALGGDAAARMFGDSWWTRLLGGLAGGVAPGAAGAALRTTRADLAQESTRGLTEADLRAAQQRMAEARASGLGEVNASQAMDKPSALDSMTALLANSKYGTATQRQLQAQPGQVDTAVQGVISKLPGAVESPNAAANLVQAGATNAINDANASRTQLWTDTVRNEVNPIVAQAQQAAAAAQAKRIALEASLGPVAAQASPMQAAAQAAIASAKQAEAVAMAKAKNAWSVPAGDVMGEVGRLKAMAKTMPNTDTGAQLSTLADKLIGPDGKPLTDPIQINDALKDLSDGLKRTNQLGMTGVALGTIKKVDSEINTVRENLGPAFDPIRKANQLYGDFTDSTINPLKQSVVGRVAGVGGFQADKEAVQSRVFSALDAGTVPGAKTSDILTLEKELRGTAGGPEAFQTAVKTWMSKKLADAGAGPGLATPNSLPGKMQAVLGLEGKATAQSQGMNDTLVALARSQGLPDPTLVNGMKQVRQFVAMAAKRPNVVGDAQKQLETTGAGVAQETLRDNPSSALFGIRRVISNFRSGDAQAFMDRLLTTPEGMDTLITLSRSPVMGAKAITAMSTFLGTQAGANSDQINQK